MQILRTRLSENLNIFATYSLILEFQISLISFEHFSCYCWRTDRQAAAGVQQVLHGTRRPLKSCHGI